MSPIHTLIFPALFATCVIAFPQYNPFPVPPPPGPVKFVPPQQYIGRPVAPPPPPPQAQVAARQYSEVSKDAQAQIVSEYRDVNFDGTFQYGFESNNGIAMKAEGYVKDPQSEYPEQVIQGSYSYYDKDNKPVNVNFVADKDGFRAESDIIPKPSPQILRSLEINAAAAAAGKSQ